MLETLAETQKHHRWSGLAAFGLLVLAGCCTLNAAPQDRGARKPRPEVFNQEIVEIKVDLKKKTIKVLPEKVEIYFQWNPEKRNQFNSEEVRWVVTGLDEDHVLHIVPKEKSPEGVFPIPRKFQGRPAYSIDGRKFNSILSGEVEELRYLKRGKGYVNRRRGENYENEDPYIVVWSYDVIVADRRGNVKFKVDPQVVIHGHP